VASAGELGDELRRIAADLPLELLAGAVALLESAQQRLTAVLIGSSQYEAMELLGLIDQAVQAARDAQQLGTNAQAAIQTLADETGAGGTTGTAAGGLGAGVRPGGTGQSGRPGGTPRPADGARLSPTRRWKTIAEEVGHQVFRSFSAAKRALGSRPGQEIHHLVEQSPALPARSGFGVSRINTTDNMVWVPVAVHRRVSGEYSRIVPGAGMSLRDSLNDESWEQQYARGQRELNRAWKAVDADD
jgi:hypothetical protein